MHEAQLHTKTSFVTLTYNDASLPSTRRGPDGPRARDVRLGLPQRIDNDTHAETHAHEIQPEVASLSKADLHAFTQRLNSDVRRRSGKGVKYYACGEYGDRTNRPHYHIAIYGEDFTDDRIYWKRAQSGNNLYRSSRLARLWPHGDADIGDLTFESAAYIARYILKKITGTKALDHYLRTNERGEQYWLTPEFNVMSRRPGIAKEWITKYKDDVYPHDHVISRGYPAKPPRYYDKYLEEVDPYLLTELKLLREDKATLQEADNTNARLETREIVALAKLNQTKRSLE
ncbi:replication initiator protein [robinz microvirus RP_71]|nr:replication initiator protein [robinz microvirus RP_71]